MSPEVDDRKAPSTLPTIDDIAFAFQSRTVTPGAVAKRFIIATVLKHPYNAEDKSYDPSLLPSERYTETASPAFQNLVKLLLKRKGGGISESTVKAAPITNLSSDAMKLAEDVFICITVRRANVAVVVSLEIFHPMRTR